MPTGTAERDIVKGRKITWVVVYWENKERTYVKERPPKGKVIDRLFPREENDPGDRLETVPMWEKVDKNGKLVPGGFTAADGVTTLVGRFTDADHLAFILEHESLHFEQFIDPKTAGLSYNEKEVRAWKSTRDRVSRFIDDPAWGAFYKNSAQYAVNEYYKDLQRDRYNKGLYGRGSVDSPARTPEELQAITAHAKELERSIHDESFARHMLAVQALAEKACEDFWSITADDRDVGNFPPSDYDGLRCAYAEADSCRTKMLCDIIGRLGARWRIESAWLEQRHWAVLASEPMGTPPTAEDVNSRSVPTAPIVRTPLFAAFDIARLAKIACSGGDYRKGFSEFSWFPDPIITMKQTPLSELGGCARNVYDKLMAANEKGDAGISSLPIDEWVSAAAAPPSSAPPSARGDNHPIDLSHPKQYIPSITPPRWH